MSDFSQLGVADPIVAALRELGYEAPTPIQEQSIPILLQGSDLLAQAQLALGQPQASLQVCDTGIAAAKEDEALSTELAFEQLRWDCLL